MSTFKCPVVELVIKEHPNADSIEIAEVGMFQSIVKKGEFKTGDLAIYIPEGAICPEEVLKKTHAWDEVKNRGKLTGAKYDRVKPIKLRGVVSEGLIHPFNVCNLPTFEDLLGVDCSEVLKITKYEPPIPSHLIGPNQPQIAGQLFGYTPTFDVENLKSNKNAFVVGEEVRITEKLHGTCCIIGCFYPGVIEELGINIDKENLYKDQLYVGTKRLTKRGIVFNPNDESTVYSRVNKANGVFDKILDEVNSNPSVNLASIVVLGEIFGKGVQDLGYNLEPEFRVFDIWFSLKEKPNKFHKYSNYEISKFCGNAWIAQVPEFWHGAYKEELLEFKEGKSLLCPSQIREGIVIRSEDGSKLYKLVSDAYLSRKEGTEYE